MSTTTADAKWSYKAAAWRSINPLRYDRNNLFPPWLTDLQAGLVHIYASSTAGNWKKWDITLLSHGMGGRGKTAKYYGSKYF